MSNSNPETEFAHSAVKFKGSLWWTVITEWDGMIIHDIEPFTKESAEALVKEANSRGVDEIDDDMIARHMLPFIDRYLQYRDRFSEMMAAGA